MVSVGRFRTSSTESTTRPTVMPLASTTTIRVDLVASVGGSPNRLRRSRTGITRPRRLMTPSTNAGAWGMAVIS